MAFGVLTKKMYLALSPDIINVLLSNCVPKGDDSDEAESRKQALRSLINAIETIGIENITSEHRNQVLDVLFRGYEDYAVDNRGDVGSWVRQEAML